MNVIFLDIDGVLNGYHSKNENTPNIDIEKIEILAYICELLNCHIVLSSSWKLGRCVLRKDDTFGMAPYLEYLLEIFKQYNIDFLGFTPDMKKTRGVGYQDMWKNDDIRLYLWKHPEIEHFCIIDDDLFDLPILKDYVVKTKYYSEDNDEGLTLEHIVEIDQILQKENIYNKEKRKSLVIH